MSLSEHMLTSISNLLTVWSLKYSVISSICHSNWFKLVSQKISSILKSSQNKATWCEKIFLESKPNLISADWRKWSKPYRVYRFDIKSAPAEFKPSVSVQKWNSSLFWPSLPLLVVSHEWRCDKKFDFTFGRFQPLAPPSSPASMPTRMFAWCFRQDRTSTIRFSCDSATPWTCRAVRSILRGQLAFWFTAGRKTVTVTSMLRHRVSCCSIMTLTSFSLTGRRARDGSPTYRHGTESSQSAFSLRHTWISWARQSTLISEVFPSSDSVLEVCDHKKSCHDDKRKIFFQQHTWLELLERTFALEESTQL